MCSDSNELRKHGCSGVHVVVAKESDVTERMMHTGGEQIQGNGTRNFRDGGRESALRGGGGVSWTAQALFAWTRTLDEPMRSGKCGYIAAGLLHTALTCPIRALRACAVLDCWRHGIARQWSPLRCLLRVFARCAKKKIFNSLTSFSRWKWFLIIIRTTGGRLTVSGCTMSSIHSVYWCVAGAWLLPSLHAPHWWKKCETLFQAMPIHVLVQPCS